MDYGFKNKIFEEEFMPSTFGKFLEMYLGQSVNYNQLHFIWFDLAGKYLIKLQ
jgi:hypothetical protein